MSSQQNLGILPTDLILDIFSRLPSKSIARFRCLSKLWASLLTIGSPYFTELFLTHSKTRPRLLFISRAYKQCCLYSCPRPQISSTNSESFISVTAEFHMVLPKTNSYVDISPSAAGLMYIYNMPDMNNPTLCNPSTRHIFRLPQLTKTVRSYFGYDPINKHFSVLALSHPLRSNRSLPSSYQILKLGCGRLSWRSLNCPLQHSPSKDNICINGILYYMARLVSKHSHKIVCFDLNSEEFKFIDQPCDAREPERLVNFKGKLGATNAEWNKKTSHLGVILWVLEDIEKQEWSKHVYDIFETKLWNKNDETFHIVGMTAIGDIVLTPYFIDYPLYVYFFNIETKTLQKVEIQGVEFLIHHCFLGFVDYVEELRALNWS